MTASRGGLVGAVLAMVIGAYMFRHLVSYSRSAGWVLGSIIVLVLFMSLSQYGGLLTERVFGQSANIDASYATSGRTEIWLDLFTTMAQQPLTFITGYGWNVYWSMPFQFSPHNHYFALWFNLGLVGLVAGGYLLFGALSRARRASLVAAPDHRRQLIAFVVGGMAVCVAVFFVDLHDPWIWFWMYTGAAMRLALSAELQVASFPAPRHQPRGLERPRDAYGWEAVQGRR
jgi:hypothetical protein